MSCPYSRRGHRWSQRAELATGVVICRKCGALGYIDKQGVVRVGDSLKPAPERRMKVRR